MTETAKGKELRGDRTIEDMVFDVEWHVARASEESRAATWELVRQV